MTIRHEPTGSMPFDATQPFVPLDDVPEPAQHGGATPWKIIIADDDDAVHGISKMVLRDFRFEGRYLHFLSAHSGEATRRLVAEHPDAAILLLDVVMETENAGLDVVRHVRDVLRNPFIRIILRTGQPGQAPESWVVVNYDINDYKEKTELTAQKLVTTVIAALRAYRDIQVIERSRRGLEQIIEASRNLFEPQSLAQFSKGVLQQLTALLHLGADSVHLKSAGFAAERETDTENAEFHILAGTGVYESTVGRRMAEAVPGAVVRRLLQARDARQTLIDANDFVGYFRSSTLTENLVYLHTRRLLNDVDADLLQLFASNVGIAFDNVHLNEELTNAQLELVHMLCELIEARSSDTGRHVVRVGEFSCRLGQLIGLPERECQLLRQAAPMHDLGKIAIPDAILCQPGRLDAAQFEVIKTHTTIGHRLLARSRRPAMRAAALIAQQHHESWDGGGYPDGRRGEQIHLYGRIVGLADTFDALANKRVHKAAWPMHQVMDYVQGQSGARFDPRLVRVLNEHLEDFVRIQEDHPDAAAA
ncbi:DUF3369 domain-containing protein [Aquincola sp. S2]|uniref:DUF3369 domain-containing protein n=1 Tax=Pseudaquabacterium terrae TaxID=2732868 RepID=A0ABX2EHG8_9BURK|nr:DUF3369 domain-containing protein [Aquabacterium terrae]NRF68075.1 DUF3369 domain-containing protein [Aquabacterium terrae]